MRFPIFGAVTNYPEMLNKISVSTFIYAILATANLRGEIQGFDSLLTEKVESIQAFRDLKLTVLGAKFGVGTVLPPLVFAILARIFKMHDRISDVFRIRYRFDVTSSILIPLAIGSCNHVYLDLIEKINRNRNDLMPKVFYKFASSTPGRAQIDEHLIIMALDMWSWYWIILEMVTVNIIVTVILVISGLTNWISFLFIITMLELCLIYIIKIRAERYAMAQVKEILSDSGRRAMVETEFDAL